MATFTNLSMLVRIKRTLVGQPYSNSQLHETEVKKRYALPILSSDALSSVAYASEATLRVLVLTGVGFLWLANPISWVIALLLSIVALSYSQTIKAYPRGGGAYIVSRDNLGTIPSLTAGAALLIDYILTVSVSMSAAVAAISSATPELQPFRVVLAVCGITFLTLVNIRGIRESGMIVAPPTYLFIVLMFAMIAKGMWNVATDQVVLVGTPVISAVPSELHPLTFLLMLRAFSAGCTALTGVEAISDGVPIFREPKSLNARITLMVMAAIAVIMFIGITFLMIAYGVQPDGAHESETANSMLIRGIFGQGIMYYLMQVATMGILLLASNTSFADFPRLAFFLSRDRYLPNQFRQRGDRLAFNNGILLLGIVSSLIVMIFQAKEQTLLPLYAVGVFISFTLSQSGMVQKWRTDRASGWKRYAWINGVGAICTGIVGMVLAVTKFLEGAWVVIILIPILVTLMLWIHYHYRQVSQQLRLDSPEGATYLATLKRHCEHMQVTGVKTNPRHILVVPISDLNVSSLPALIYAAITAYGNFHALHVDIDPDQPSRQKVKDRWNTYINKQINLVIIDSPYRLTVETLLSHLENLIKSGKYDAITVALPWFVPAHVWEQWLHNHTARRMQNVITHAFWDKDVEIRVTINPYYLQK